MASTDQRRVPLAEAYRAATGLEPPPPMTADQRVAWEQQLRAVQESAREIYAARVDLDEDVDEA